jgi:nucleotide-binding universal stress UspA family protein
MWNLSVTEFLTPSGVVLDHELWASSTTITVRGERLKINPCSALLRMIAAPNSVDLIVVGSRGSEQHSGSLLGSTSLELAELSSVPVVIVPAVGSESVRPTSSSGA